MAPTLATFLVRWASPCVALAAVIGGAIALERYRRRHSAPLPPMAPLTAWDVVHHLTSPGQVQFQFETGKALGSPVYRMALPFGRTIYVVMDPETAVAVLEDVDIKPHIYQGTERAFSGPNLISIPTISKRWYGTRKGLSPLFNPVLLAQKIPALHDRTDQLIALLDRYAVSGEPVDICPLLLHFALDFLCLSIFEYDLHTTEDPVGSDGAYFLRELEIVLYEYAQRQVVHPLRRFMFWNSEVRRGALAARNLQALALKILDEYRRKHSGIELQQSKSIIAEMLRNPYYEDDFMRASDISLFLMAGHESTSNSIAWMLYDLATHPEVAAELQAELDSCMTEDERLTAVQLNNLQLLGACIKESMRIWPVFATGFSRQNSKPIYYNGMAIPVGSFINVCFYGVGRWPEGIQDPDKYCPRRWFGSPEEVAALETRSIGFSKGRRNCIGQNLAKLEMRLVLARLMRRFNFTVIQLPTPYSAMSYRPLGLLMHVSPRDSVQH